MLIIESTARDMLLVVLGIMWAMLCTLEVDNRSFDDVLCLNVRERR